MMMIIMSRTGSRLVVTSLETIAIKQVNACMAFYPHALQTDRQLWLDQLLDPYARNFQLRKLKYKQFGR